MLRRKFYYKSLDRGMNSPFVGGRLVWSLPHNGKPGNWMPPVEGKITICRRGYHVFELEHIKEWANENLFLAQGRGRRTKGYDKSAFRSLRLVRHLETWNHNTLMLWAADCWEYARPNDSDFFTLLRRHVKEGLSQSEVLVAARNHEGTRFWGYNKPSDWLVHMMPRHGRMTMDTHLQYVTQFLDDLALTSDSKARKRQKAWQWRRLEAYLRGYVT